MTIGLLQIEFLIPGSRSLKDKRRVMQSLKKVMRSRYNVSVSEVDYKDKWGRSLLAVCIVGDDQAFVNKQLNEVVRFSETHGDAQLLDFSIEMI